MAQNVLNLSADRLPGRRVPPAKKARGTAVKPAAAATRAGDVSHLWERLRAMRRFADLRQIDVANKIGKSRATIALWESHLDDIRTQPSAEDVRVYAEICKVPVSFAMDNRAHPDDVWKLRANNPAAGATHSAPAVNGGASAARNSLLGMEDRRARTFWSAVEFHMPASMADAFLHTSQGPDFVNNGNAVVFASDTVEAKALLVGAMSVLLQYEKAAGKTLAKHVLVFAGSGGASINESEAEKLWGISVRQVDNLKDAAKYLQAL